MGLAGDSVERKWNSADMITMLVDGPLKQTAAVRKHTTFFTFCEVQSLPIRNGFSCVTPQGRLENAELMIIDGYSHISYGQKFYCFLKLILIVMRVDPQFLDIARSVSGIFQTH